jgi:3D (Asp-Asp-Asp) domain-containing protein
LKYADWVDIEQSASSLYSKSGKSLGVTISNDDFCFGALQGTIRVQVDSGIEIYNADGLAPVKSAVCFYKKLGSTVNEQLGRQAWVKVAGNAEFGLGVQGKRLIPFRTIAVDTKYTPIGTVFFIPKLRGWHFNDSGVERVHDGYVIAGDKGGGIVGKSHIDFFTGNYTGVPPDFVTSDPSGLFDAEIVSDKNVKDTLRNESRYIPDAKSQDGS